MSLRPSARTLVLAAALAAASACGSPSSGPADAGLRRLAAADLEVRVDSVVGHFDPRTITFAAFTVKNVSANALRVGGCIEGLAAGIEREVDGEWRFLGGTMCWGSDPRHGFPLAAGASIDGGIQVLEPGRYRVVVRFVRESDRDTAHDAASAPFDAR